MYLYSLVRTLGQSMYWYSGQSVYLYTLILVLDQSVYLLSLASLCVCIVRFR